MQQKQRMYSGQTGSVHHLVELDDPYKLSATCCVAAANENPQNLRGKVLVSFLVMTLNPTVLL